jgi:hypothetical protein
MASYSLLMTSWSLLMAIRRVSKIIFQTLYQSKRLPILKRRPTNPISIGTPFPPAYIIPLSGCFFHLGGVATVCNPSGGRLLWTWGARYGPAEAC